MENILNRLKDLYEAMDTAYNDLAAHYGFSCKGCTDNCCSQRFYHYTLAEHYYLFEGIKKIDDEFLEKILRRAKIVTDTYYKEIEMGEILRMQCPLNFDGLCSLYEYRPMICRLHGLPHSFKRPDGEIILGTGCQRFQDEINKEEARLDRTPFYRELAEIEKDLRLTLKRYERYKKTTAQMLMDMAEASVKEED